MSEETIEEPEKQDLLKEKKKINKLLSTIQQGSQRIVISRVPEPTRDKFFELANKEFCGDRGMALKWLIDGLIDNDAQIFNARIDEIEANVAMLYQALQGDKEEKNTIKMVNGAKRRIRK